MAEWPRHLRLARKILSDELSLDDKRARDVVSASYFAAHICAQAINQRSRDIAAFNERLKLRKVFGRLGKCAQRSPAYLRRVLNRGVSSAIHERMVDAENIEALVHALVTGFARFPKEASSLTVLRAIMPRTCLPKSANFENRNRLRHRFSKASHLLQQHYAALRASDQQAIESVLTRLHDTNPEFDSADICAAISHALGRDEGNVIGFVAHDLITDYAVAISQIWRQHGIRAARARNPQDPAYRGKFHRFADLVLTSVVDPWSKRHDGDQQDRLTRLRKTHAELPKEIREAVRPVARRVDVEWLVSDDHIRKAIARIKKTAPQTP